MPLDPTRFENLPDVAKRIVISRVFSDLNADEPDDILLSDWEFHKLCQCNKEALEAALDGTGN